MYERYILIESLTPEREKNNILIVESRVQTGHVPSPRLEN